MCVAYINRMDPRNEQYDLLIHTSNGSINFYRTLLFIHSEYIAALITGGFKENGSCEITVEGDIITVKTAFDIIMDICKKKPITLLTAENVVNILEFADKYCFDALICVCDEFLVDLRDHMNNDIMGTLEYSVRVLNVLCPRGSNFKTLKTIRVGSEKRYETKTGAIAVKSACEIIGRLNIPAVKFMLSTDCQDLLVLWLAVVENRRYADEVITDEVLPTINTENLVLLSRLVDGNVKIRVLEQIIKKELLQKESMMANMWDGGEAFLTEYVKPKEKDK